MYKKLYKKSYTESRARYAQVLDMVTNDREEVVITRAGHENVVIVSLDEYESLKETAHLMRSPANARQLFDAIERLENGLGQEHALIEASAEPGLKVSTEPGREASAEPGLKADTPIRLAL